MFNGYGAKQKKTRGSSRHFFFFCFALPLLLLYKAAVLYIRVDCVVFYTSQVQLPGERAFMNGNKNNNNIRKVKGKVWASLALTMYI